MINFCWYNPWSTRWFEDSLFYSLIGEGFILCLAVYFLTCWFVFVCCCFLHLLFLLLDIYFNIPSRLLIFIIPFIQGTHVGKSFQSILQYLQNLSNKLVASVWESVCLFLFLWILQVLLSENFLNFAKRFWICLEDGWWFVLNPYVK